MSHHIYTSLLLERHGDECYTFGETTTRTKREREREREREAMHCYKVRVYKHV